MIRSPHWYQFAGFWVLEIDAVASRVLDLRVSERRPLNSSLGIERDRSEHLLLDLLRRSRSIQMRDGKLCG